jgi:basic membrane protein A
MPARREPPVRMRNTDRIATRSAPDVFHPYDFAAGGKTGAGALVAVREKGRRGIGVDLDRYGSLPAVKDCLLTSCLKKMDNAVYALKDVLTNRFRGGGVMTGSLANGQVGLAPYHSMEKQIPDRIKQDVPGLQQALKSGGVPAGWPPREITISSLP